MPSKSMRKGAGFERAIIHEAEAIGLKAYRNRMSRSPEGDASWDVCVAGRYLEAKVRKDSFKKIRQWIEGVDGVVLGTDRESALVVIRLKDWLGML